MPLLASHKYNPMCSLLILVMFKVDPTSLLSTYQG